MRSLLLKDVTHFALKMIAPRKGKQKKYKYFFNVWLVCIIYRYIWSRLESNDHQSGQGRSFKDFLPHVLVVIEVQKFTMLESVWKSVLEGQRNEYILRLIIYIFSPRQFIPFMLRTIQKFDQIMLPWKNLKKMSKKCLWDEIINEMLGFQAICCSADNFILEL